VDSLFTCSRCPPRKGGGWGMAQRSALVGTSIDIASAR